MEEGAGANDEITLAADDVMTGVVLDEDEEVVSEEEEEEEVVRTSLDDVCTELVERDVAAAVVVLVLL